MLRRHIALMTGCLICGCSDSEVVSREDHKSGRAYIPSVRWYSEQQVENGSTIFENNCSECHGAHAEGRVANWKQKLKDGSFPPPPLDGSAHAWHHPRTVLLEVINGGGLDYGGKMPAFRDVLESDEKLAAIAYFQSFWDDETYHQWEAMDGAL